MPTGAPQVLHSAMASSSSDSSAADGAVTVRAISKASGSIMLRYASAVSI